MNIKFRNFVWLYGVVLGIFLVSNAYAWPEGKHCFRGEGKEGMKEKMEERFKEISKELNLTPEQEEQLKNHRAQGRREMEGFHEKISGKMEEIDKELQKQELDMEKVEQLNSELKAIHSEMQDNRLKDILKVREILSPEQFIKFKEFIGKHHPGMKGRRKAHGPMEKGGE